VFAQKLIERQGAGAIVNVSSQASCRALRNQVVYCTSKAAVDQMTRSLAFELGPRGVRFLYLYRPLCARLYCLYFCCPSTTSKHTAVSIKWRGAGILLNRVWLILAGLLKQLLGWLHSVQNVAAWRLFTARCQDYVQPLVRSLYWLRVAECILFWPVVLVYRCLHGSEPGYCTWHHISSVPLISMHIGNCALPLRLPSLLHGT